MTDHPWLSHIVNANAVDQLCNALVEGRSARAYGSRGSSTTIVAGALAHRLARPVLLTVAHLDDADDAIEDLRLFNEAGYPIQARRFGALEILPGETGVNLELLAERLDLVAHLRQNVEAIVAQPLVLIAPVQALMQAVPDHDLLRQMYLALEAQRDLPTGQLLGWLSDSGYDRVETIESPGEFSMRGGIVDIYAPAATGCLAVDAGRPDGAQPVGPIRLDYFGDQIESIRRVDLDTMGSGQQLSSVRIVGASPEKLQADNNTVNLLSLLPDRTLVVMHELLELSEQARGYYERLGDPRGIYPPKSLFKALTDRQHVQVDQYSLPDRRPPATQACVQLPVTQLESFDADAAKSVAELAAIAEQSKHTPSKHSDEAPRTPIVVLCQNVAEKERLAELLRQTATPAPDGVLLETGYLHRGFIWEDRLRVVPHHELFHRYHTRRRIRRVGTNAAGKASDAFVDLEPGDYVVHVDHGIARFVGLKSLRRKGRMEDYLTLEFSGRAQLHVPAAQIELVQKYIGGFHGHPPLSTLGGKRWAKQKQQVAEAVKDLAAELLRVQAARASMPGIRYPDDTTWQREFEAEFPYDETEDQIAAIAQVKKDMGDGRPMDRLICGDVGFGKTEVAIRAVFKAIEAGKQVAVLVPTTVLAEQHERTFKERMADYPFRIESLSRFKTAGQASKVLRDLGQGKVDVIIGTHRLLSKDVAFADLGLVVIDEEQRFGVEHKQKLMQLRLTVDVLTLSATPIPRTLHMSMLGLRDISSLSTPPLDRRAIVSEVIPFDEQRIKHAIVRELNRQGQVYFVHNRVHNIRSLAGQIKSLVPDAQIAVGHGQMRPKELEQIMLKFMRRQIDILVCTTIIESGIDIPTANTIFINAADHFGLADLHQLRGRVGRYKHRAYCYLLLPQNRPITETATKRLAAIEQYAMLGAGFKIAMRDLEIRGAGNLLGAEQSGHIAAVGYEMYCQILERATKRLQNQPILEPAKTHIELPVSAQLPKSYIGSEKFRMEAYRRLSRASRLDELDAVVQDLTDAFGQPVPKAQALIDLTEIRIAATMIGVESIRLDGPDVIFKIPHPAKLDRALRNAPGRVSMIDDHTVYFRPPSNYLEPATLLAVLRKLLVQPYRLDTAPTLDAVS